MSDDQLLVLALQHSPSSEIPGFHCLEFNCLRFLCNSWHSTKASLVVDGIIGDTGIDVPCKTTEPLLY